MIWYPNKSSLKKLLRYLKEFVHQDYTPSVYLFVCFFLIAGISFNYSFQLENQWIRGQENFTSEFFSFLVLYCLAYYGVLFSYLLIQGKNYFKNRALLLKSFLALVLIAFDRSFDLSSGWLQYALDTSAANALYLSKIINLFYPSIVYLLIIFLIYKLYDRGSGSVYGFSLRRFDVRPYGYMLLCMIPLLFWASLQPDFTNQYPFFKYWRYEPAFDWSGRKMFWLYEFFYLANFINIELVFRGLLVIGLVRAMGKDAVLPMVVTYAFLHFGKPCAETISSVFGGYILGVFAYRTENIMGGIFIHIAIAFLMDLFALWQLS
ncbi:MAG TPA: CPBP family intramembrane glutamic endopeptidase [Cytophagaceae bacterium]|nr:CPBP family intramembrane glutamic endopeptidase [Cytophagaceae bacterium]